MKTEDALARAERWGMGEPRTYMPYRSEMSFFRRMEAKGLVRWHECDLANFTYSGYEITDEGHKLLAGG